MQWKFIVYALAIILALVIIGGIGVKLTQKAEGYKSNKDQYFHTFEPHFLIGGCANYNVMRAKEEQQNKKEIAK